MGGPGGGNGCNGCKGPFHPRQMYRHCKTFMDFDIVDEVFIPQLEEGDYILSFRWESEQTPQVWTQCADVKIMNNRTVVWGDSFCVFRASGSRKARVGR